MDTFWCIVVYTLRRILRKFKAADMLHIIPLSWVDNFTKL